MYLSNEKKNQKFVIMDYLGIFRLRMLSLRYSAMALIGLSTSDCLNRVCVLGRGSIVSGCVGGFFLTPFVLGFFTDVPSFVM